MTNYVGHFGAKNVKPLYIGEISAKYYDGDSDDLLTGGFGKTGLAAAAPPFANLLAPTPEELRRNAIHTNYRAVLDITAAGGYGTLYGPNVTNDGGATASEGKIPGWEYLTYADDGTGRKNVTLMVQIPDHFDLETALHRYRHLLGIAASTEPSGHPASGGSSRAAPSRTPTRVPAMACTT